MTRLIFDPTAERHRAERDNRAEHFRDVDAMRASVIIADHERKERDATIEAAAILNRWTRGQLFDVTARRNADGDPLDHTGRPIG